MDFTLIHENKLKVTLPAEDMKSLELDYDEMDYTDPTTRKALLYLLDNAKRQAGFNPRKAKLFIEVYPCEGGGCVLYFTNLHTQPKTGGVGMEPVVFQFEDADTLIEGACMVFERYSHRIYKSSLYLVEGRYRLVVHPLDYSDRLSVYFLSEYAEKLGEGEMLAALTEEHGKELIRDTAIDTLAEYFGGDAEAAGGLLYREE